MPGAVSATRGRLYHHGRCEDALRGVLVAARSEHIASAMSAGLRDDGIRRYRLKRTPAGVRTADSGEVTAEDVLLWDELSPGAAVGI